MALRVWIAGTVKAISYAAGREITPLRAEEGSFRSRIGASTDVIYWLFFLLKKTLTHSHMGMYCNGMPRAATTSDAFNAVAEPRRRDILNYLALQERHVGEIVASLGMEQPSVSKHLRVLKDVGLVHVRREGRHMLYRTNAEAVRPLHEWASTFERFWKHQLSRIKERAEEKMQKVESDASSSDRISKKEER